MVKIFAFFFYVLSLLYQPKYYAWVVIQNVLKLIGIDALSTRRSVTNAQINNSISSKAVPFEQCEYIGYTSIYGYPQQKVWVKADIACNESEMLIGEVLLCFECTFCCHKFDYRPIVWASNEAMATVCVITMGGNGKWILNEGNCWVTVRSLGRC